MGEATAVQRLDTALGEQARLADQYDRAIGTSAELSSFARLQAANLSVAMCHRAVRTSHRTTVPPITSAQGATA